MSHSYISQAELEKRRKDMICEQINSELQKLMRRESDKKNVIKKQDFLFLDNLKKNDENKINNSILNVTISESAFKKSDNLKQSSRSRIILETKFDRNDKSREKLISAIQEFDELTVSEEFQEKKDNVSSWIKDCINGNEDVTRYAKDIYERIDSFNKEMEKSKSNDIKKEIEILCQLLNKNPEEYLDKDLSRERERLFRILQSRKEKEYIRESISEVLQGLGYELEEEVSLAESEKFVLDGSLYANSSLKGSKLFVALNGEDMVLETIANDISKGVTEKNVMESAEEICQHKRSVVEKLAEKGIKVNLNDDLNTKPVLKEMVKLTDIKKQKNQVSTEKKKESARSRSMNQLERTISYDE